MEHVLHLALKKDELLVLQLVHPCRVVALSGAHWLTVDGDDICLHSGQHAQLPAGKLLLEGQGRLDLQGHAAKPHQGSGLRLGFVSV